MTEDDDDDDDDDDGLIKEVRGGRDDDGDNAAAEPLDKPEPERKKSRKRLERRVVKASKEETRPCVEREKLNHASRATQ